MSDEQTKNDTLTPIRARKAPKTPEQRAKAQRVFLDSLRTDGNVTDACDKAEISRETAYTWREKYTDFAAQWNEAQERFNDRIRMAFVSRGIEGYDEPVVSQGKVVMGSDGQILTVRRYSDTLLLALARSRMPEFREKQQVEHSGSVDVTGAKELLLQKLQSLKEQEEKPQE